MSEEDLEGFQAPSQILEESLNEIFIPLKTEEDWKLYLLDETQKLCIILVTSAHCRFCEALKPFFIRVGSLSKVQSEIAGNRLGLFRIALHEFDISSILQKKNLPFSTQPSDEEGGNESQQAPKVPLIVRTKIDIKGTPFFISYFGGKPTGKTLFASNPKKIRWFLLNQIEQYQKVIHHTDSDSHSSLPENSDNESIESEDER